MKGSRFEVRGLGTLLCLGQAKLAPTSPNGSGIVDLRVASALNNEGLATEHKHTTVRVAANFEGVCRTTDSAECG